MILYFLKIVKYFITYMETLIENRQEVIDARKNLLEIIDKGQSKEFLGKVYTNLNGLSGDQILELNEKYENKLSSQMSKALGKSIIRAYSTIACKLLKIDSEDDLCKDLNEDPFLNKALQRITCNLYYNFGEYLAPVSVALITGKHYTSSPLVDTILDSVTYHLEFRFRHLEFL